MGRRVLITGADGQLGRAISARWQATDSVVALDRAALDITDAAAVLDAARRLQPGVVVNCAAYNAVDQAQDDAETAIAVNAIAVRNLARAAADAGAVLVHYSSDFVFDGASAVPYTEADLPNPRSIYAASKLMGEWLAQMPDRWFVLRVESLFGTGHFPAARRVGSIDRIMEGLEQRRPTRVFTDRVVSPSYVVDVAEATIALVGAPATSGIYHVVNSGHCTWHELALEAARYVGGAEHVEPVPAASASFAAERPLFSALSNRKLAAAAYDMPTWQDALQRYLQFRAARPDRASGR